MLRVADRLFAGRTDLLALDVDTERLAEESPVIREPARSGESVSARVWAHRSRRGGQSTRAGAECGRSRSVYVDRRCVKRSGSQHSVLGRAVGHRTGSNLFPAGPGSLQHFPAGRGGCAWRLSPTIVAALAAGASGQRPVGTAGRRRRIESFSVYGLFPATYPLVYGPDSGQSTVRYDGRTRGRVAIIEHETTTVVIKPCQSGRETEIAAIAGELEVGPAQLPTISGFITEGFVHGTFLTDLSDDDVVPDRMREVGVALACALSSLHGAGVCYNDATICDPEGRSHIIVRPDGSIRLIDFGVALLLDDHPRSLTFGDAWNAARTDPMFRLFRQMTGGADDDALRRFVADYGRRLAGQTVEQIQSRDWRIAEEGVSIIASRFGPGAADALREGLGLAR